MKNGDHAKRIDRPYPPSLLFSWQLVKEILNSMGENEFIKEKIRKQLYNKTEKN